MVVRVARFAPPPPTELAVHGRECLYDRGLLRRWFIIHRLGEEIAEARRYAYPLSTLVLSPMITCDDRDAEARVTDGAVAARAAARASDLIGWLDGDDILIVLPHTARDGAAAAIQRWRTEMMKLGTTPLRWLVSAIEDANTYESVDALLGAAMNAFRGLE